jgi:hypothetical protein
MNYRTFVKYLEGQTYGTMAALLERQRMGEGHRWGYPCGGSLYMVGDQIQVVEPHNCTLGNKAHDDCRLCEPQPWAQGYPLKYHVEMRNDSSKSLEVRLSNYKAKAITLKSSFPPEVMQVRFNNRWFPSEPTDRVAVLPGQLCRAWIGMDDTKFTEAQLSTARGNIGTLIISANGKQVSFEL